MKNTVSVKKCKNHRIFTAVFSVCMMGIMAFFTAFIGIKGIILSIPLLLILLPMNLYYFTWRIDLEPNAIVHRLFFREVKRYTYSELQDVIRRYSLAEYDICIIMIFKDGKMLSFRRKDEGFDRAVRTLKHHHSITSK